MAAIGPQVRIRDLRVALGLTLPQLAERIAAFGVTVDPDHLSNVELGHKRARPHLLRAWAQALNVDPIDVTQPDPVPRRRAA